MPSTTHAEFGPTTEALEVAKAFADQVRGKNIIVTGANSGGIGYTTLEAFVRCNPCYNSISNKAQVYFRPLNLQRT